MNPEENPNAADGDPPQGLPPARLRFGEFELDVIAGVLRRNGHSVPLQRRPYEVLLYLLLQSPRLVRRDELLGRFWRGKDVYEDALTRCVSSIRKALDDQAEPHRYLETRWATGYRILVPIEADASALLENPPPTATAGSAPQSVVQQPAPTQAPRSWRLVAAVAALALLVAGLLAESMRPRPEQETNGGGPTRIRRLVVLAPSGAGPTAELLPSASSALVQSVSEIEGLTVIDAGVSTTSVQDSLRLGQEYRADALLESAVRRDEDMAVLAVRLLDARDGSVLWNFELDAPASTADTRNTEVTAQLARHLSARLHRRPDARPDSTDAYRTYLRARQYLANRSGSSIVQASDLFEQVTRQEPGFAPAQIGLAESLLLRPLYAGDAPRQMYPRARAAAETALRLDPESSRAHAVLGVISSQFDWNWIEADSHFNRAVELDPNDATAQQWRAESFCFRRRFEQCARGLRIARALDQLSPVHQALQALPARFSGSDALARGILEDAHRANPDFAFAEFQLGLVESAAGDWTSAIMHLEQVRSVMGPVLGGAPLAYAYARAGRTADAEKIQHELEDLSRRQYVAPLAFSDIALGFGDREGALRWLDRAVEERDDFLVTIAVDHHHRDLHGDPRFEALLRRLGLPTSSG